MAERKQAQDLFLRTYKLSSFKAFNPKFKEECLSGAEMMLFLEIVRERLIYIRIDEKAWNGNTIKIDKEYREKVLENLGVGQGCFEHMLTKLTSGGILYKIRNGYYLMNPYCFAKGDEQKVKFARNMGIFRSSTINLCRLNERFRNRLQTCNVNNHHISYLLPTHKNDKSPVTSSCIQS